MSGKRARAGSTPLFEAQCRTRGERVPEKTCRECGKKVTGRRICWCSHECVEAYSIRSDPSHVRRRLLERDKGVCAHCGVNTERLRQRIVQATTKARQEWWDEVALARLGERRWKPAPKPDPNWREHTTNWIAFTSGDYLERHRRAILEPYDLGTWWWRRTFWDADHIIPFSKGGNECDLSNYQTLCVLCHSERTARQAKRRAGKTVIRITKRRSHESKEEYRERVLNRRRG